MACKLMIDDQEISALYIDDVEITTLYIDDQCVFDGGGPEPGQIIWDVPGDYTWTIPDKVESVSVCMVGGGGGGSAVEQGGANVYAGGGHAGQEVYTAHSVVPGSTINITVGKGGPESDDPQGEGAMVPGYDGEDSVFDSLVAAGGAGGTTSSPTTENASYKGCGDPGPTGCGGGGFYDGDCEVAVDGAYGGEASSFGDGGSQGSPDGEPGGVGAGGGGTYEPHLQVQHGGPGGRGEVRASWGTVDKRWTIRVSELSDEQLEQYGIRRV